MPSFQDNFVILDAIGGCCGIPAPSTPELLREVRYPYLDRDFLEFMFAIPREQIVRVGQAPFLMKRALVGIVPDELLNRRQKTFAPPEPKGRLNGMAQLGGDRTALIGSSWESSIQIDSAEALQKARRTRTVPIGSLNAHTDAGVLAPSPYDSRSLGELDANKERSPLLVSGG